MAASSDQHRARTLENPRRIGALDRFELAPVGIDAAVGVADGTEHLGADAVAAFVGSAAAAAAALVFVVDSGGGGGRRRASSLALFDAAEPVGVAAATAPHEQLALVGAPVVEVARHSGPAPARARRHRAKIVQRRLRRHGFIFELLYDVWVEKKEKNKSWFIIFFDPRKSLPSWFRFFLILGLWRRYRHLAS